MNTFTLIILALDRITTLRQEAQHDRLVQQARDSRAHRHWRHPFRFPYTPAPTVPCATC